MIPFVVLLNFRGCGEGYDGGGVGAGGSGFWVGGTPKGLGGMRNTTHPQGATRRGCLSWPIGGGGFFVVFFLFWGGGGGRVKVCLIKEDIASKYRGSWK
ncbi:hypothetical protein [Helicobacter pylori]|uniref:hypothetical protein n=1 Tax=Helicobacter pylori TaxID=210 RepID=UPI001F091D07|nr:hypothetical protein [Helicobacter pylori]